MKKSDIDELVQSIKVLEKNIDTQYRLMRIDIDYADVMPNEFIEASERMVELAKQYKDLCGKLKNN